MAHYRIGDGPCLPGVVTSDCSGNKVVTDMFGRVIADAILVQPHELCPTPVWVSNRIDYRPYLQIIIDRLDGQAQNSQISSYVKTITIEALADNTETTVVVPLGVDNTINWAVQVVGYAGTIQQASIDINGDITVTASNNTGGFLPAATVAVTVTKV